ncbi:MAG: CpsD/CapB family tyrosine-protein kinase [Acidobacteria bacterium]|nr:CpsD/CapB family tyrosine-protein kinase [Acidobacteriota bacterium]
MSKMFEALKKAQGEVAEVCLPLIEMAASPLPPAEPEAVEPEPPMPQPVMEAKATAPSDVQQLRHAAARLQTGSAVLPLDGASSRAAEQYRMIRTKISHHPLQPRTLLISSAGPGDGKTTSAINIAGVLSLRDDVNVLLIDADFRRAMIASSLGIPEEPGLANVIAGECSLQEAIVRVEQYPNLYVLPAGRSKMNPAEMLDSPRWRAICAAARESFRFTVLDAPPVGSVADYDLIQASCDGVIMIVRPDHTDRSMCMKALESIPREKFIGVVVNCAVRWFLWKTQDAYYYAKQA